MTVGSIRIALDLSCVMEARPTGVGYAAAYQMRALFAQARDFDFRLVATRPRGGSDALADCRDVFTRRTVLPWAGLARYYLWSWFDWPPIEWFSGEVDLAHNPSHQVPSTRNALRIVTVHDLSFIRVPETHTPRNIRIQTALIEQCVRRADAFVAVSESCKHELMDVFDVPADKIHHVPNGVCLDEFPVDHDAEALAALETRLGLTPPYFIHLGTVEPRKNIPRLLEAHARLRDRFSGDCPQLVFVGRPGWLCEPIYEAIRTHAATGRVVDAGYLDRAEALLLLRGAAACVYPSLYEGFGLPVLEAMASRTPVITSNTSSLPEVVGDTGVLVDPMDVDALEAAMADMVEKPEKARSRLDAACDRAHTFTWDRSASMLAELYRRLAG